MIHIVNSRDYFKIKEGEKTADLKEIRKRIYHKGDTLQIYLKGHERNKVADVVLTKAVKVCVDPFFEEGEHSQEIRKMGFESNDDAFNTHYEKQGTMCWYLEWEEIA